MAQILDLIWEINKWKWRRDNPEKQDWAHPDYNQFPNDCVYCESSLDDEGKVNCKRCPIDLEKLSAENCRDWFKDKSFTTKRMYALQPPEDHIEERIALFNLQLSKLYEWIHGALKDDWTGDVLWINGLIPFSEFLLLTEEEVQSQC